MGHFPVIVRRFRLRNKLLPAVGSDGRRARLIPRPTAYTMGSVAPLVRPPVSGPAIISTKGLLSLKACRRFSVGNMMRQALQRMQS